MNGTEASEELMAHVEASEANYEIFDNLLNISEKGGRYLARAQWLELPNEIDCTCKNLKELHDNISDLVSNFPQSYRYKRIAERTAQQIGFKLYKLTACAH